MRRSETVALALALAPQALLSVAAQCQDLCAAGWLSCEVDVCDPTACGAAASNATSANCLACVNSVCGASAAVFSVHINFQLTHDDLIWCVLVPFLGRLGEYILVPARAKLFPKRKVLVMSCPEMGTLDLDVTDASAFDQPVMNKVAEMQRRGLLKMGFDRAGTSTVHEEDADIDWTDKQAVRQSKWMYGFQTAAKKAMSIECQGFRGVLEVVCIQGGNITQVEHELMDVIIANARADAAKSRIDCRIEKRTLSYAAFLREYGGAGLWRWLGWLCPRSVRALCGSSDGGEGAGQESGGGELRDSLTAGLTGDEAEDTTGGHGAAQSALLPPPPLGEGADTTQEWADNLMPGAGYTGDMLYSKGSSWERAVYANGQSQLSASLAAVSKLFLWHWLQPVLYFVVFGSYWGKIDNWQVCAAAVTCMRVISRTPRLLQVVFVYIPHTHCPIKHISMCSILAD